MLSVAMFIVMLGVTMLNVVAPTQYLQTGSKRDCLVSKYSGVDFQSDDLMKFFARLGADTIKIFTPVKTVVS
jgi:hypothetical protein